MERHSVRDSYDPRRRRIEKVKEAALLILIKLNDASLTAVDLKYDVSL